MGEKEKISFKPLHEGMGFHPFSDGLPYAPESKSKAPAAKPQTPTTPNYSTGAGAVAAGRPQFATARQLKQTQVDPGVPTSKPAIISTMITPSAPAKVKKEIEPTPAVSSTEQALILRRRFFAYLMDSVIHAGFWLATNLTALFFFKFQIDAQIVQDHLGQFALFYIISQWLFIALQEMLFETSIGKAFFNLEFKRNHRSLFLRSIVFMVGVAALGLGLYYRPHDRLGQLQLKTKLYS